MSLNRLKVLLGTFRFRILCIKQQTDLILITGNAYCTVPIHCDQRTRISGSLCLKALYTNVHVYTMGCQVHLVFFTNLLKPVHYIFHNEGYLSSGYNDDSYLQGDTVEECYQNVTDTACIFSRLGLNIYPTKSVLTPSHIRTFLGFILNSLEMTVFPAQEKIQKTTGPCSGLLKMVNPPISVSIAKHRHYEKALKSSGKFFTSYEALTRGFKRFCVCASH